LSPNFFRRLCVIFVDGSTDTPCLDLDQTAGALALFQAALPAEFFRRQRIATGLPPEEEGFYTTAVVVAVVVMLMILQRLVQGKATGRYGERQHRRL
jgi:hypothetical protein